MKIRDFGCEVFFAKHEFSAPYLLCQSDCESVSVGDLLNLEPGAQEAFMNCWLGYTEVPGSPALREQIAKLYEKTDADHILVHAGAQEPIFNFMNVLLNPGDHVICLYPAYQSLYEVARAIGCQVSNWELRPTESGWTLDIDELNQLIRPNTRLVVLNSPNNPTGYCLTAQEQLALISHAERHGLWIFCDEVYKDLELDGQPRPWLCDRYEKAVSLGVMSKTYGLAGLRIGWIACRDAQIVQQMSRYKHYTTICSSAPSEFLATLALRQGKRLVERNLGIIRANLDVSKAFFARHSDTFVGYRPMAGPIAFHRVRTELPIQEFCADLLQKQGVLLLPASVYGYPGSYVRMGYGRSNFLTCLARLEEYLVASGG